MVLPEHPEQARGRQDKLAAQQSAIMKSDHYSDDSASETETVNTDNKLVSGFKWTVHVSSDDANGQTHARKLCHPFDRIIASVNLLDVEQFPGCTTPHFKVASRDSTRGFLFGIVNFIIIKLLQHKNPYRSYITMSHVL